jgi:hypothetical protein
MSHSTPTPVLQYNHWSVKDEWRSALKVALPAEEQTVMREFKCGGFDEGFGIEVETSFPNPEYDDLR